MADLTIGGVYFNEDLDATFGGNITAATVLNINRAAGSTNDRLTITSADIVTTIERVENTGDAAAGYGRIDFKTNAATGGTAGRSGFKFIDGDGDDILYLENNDSSATFAGNIATTSGKLDITSDGSAANGAEIYLKHANNNTTDTIGTIIFGNNADSTLSTIISETNGANNTSNLKFTTSNAGTLATALTLNADNSATFADVINMPNNKGVTWTGGSVRVESSVLKLVGDSGIQLQDNTTIIGNASPSADSTYDLGTTGERWSTLFVDNITITNGLPGGPYLPLTGGTLTGSGNVPLYVTSSGSVSYIQVQNSSTGTSGTSDGMTVGCNGTAGYIWLREQATLNIGTNDTSAITIDSSQNSTFAGTVLVGSGGYAYKNPKITADTDTDGPISIVVNNQENGSSAEAKFIVATYGNSWIIGMGSSTHTYGNDLTFTTDASTSNAPKLRIATNGAATFASTITIPSYIYHQSDPSDDTYFGFSGNDTFVVYTAGGNGLNIDSNRAVTLTGDLLIPEYIKHSGDTDTFFKFNSGGWEIQSSGGPTTDISATGGVTTIYGKNVAAITVGSGQLATFAGSIHLDNDSSQLQLGDDNDMQIYHNGAQGEINVATGDFTIDSVGNITLDAEGANDIIFKYKGSDTAMAIDGGASSIITSASLQVDNSIVLNGDSNIQLDTSVSSGESSGTIIKAGTHMSALVAGNLYYASNSMGSLQWAGTDADTGTKNMIALSLGTDADVDGMLLNGIYHKASHSFTVGLPIYISTTPMSMTNTAPSGSGDYVRVVGYAIDSNHIYFCPDNTWVEID